MMEGSMMKEEDASVAPSDYRSNHAAPPAAIHERASETIRNQTATGHKSVAPSQHQHYDVIHMDN